MCVFSLYHCKYRLIVCNVHLVRQKKTQNSLQNNITHSILGRSINRKLKCIHKMQTVCAACKKYVMHVSNQSKFATFSLDWIDTGVEQFPYEYIGWVAHSTHSCALSHDFNFFLGKASRLILTNTYYYCCWCKIVWIKGMKKKWPKEMDEMKKRKVRQRENEWRKFRPVWDMTSCCLFILENAFSRTSLDLHLAIAFNWTMMMMMMALVRRTSFWSLTISSDRKKNT